MILGLGFLTAPLFGFRFSSSCLIFFAVYEYGVSVSKISNNAEIYKVESEFPMKFAPRAVPIGLILIHSLTFFN